MNMGRIIGALIAFSFVALAVVYVGQSKLAPPPALPAAAAPAPEPDGAPQAPPSPAAPEPASAGEPAAGNTPPEIAARYRELTELIATLGLDEGCRQSADGLLQLAQEAPQSSSIRRSALLQRSRCARKQGRVEDEIAQLRGFLARNPADADAAIVMAKLLKPAEDAEEIRRILGPFTGPDSTDHEALELAGLAAKTLAYRSSRDPAAPERRALMADAERALALAAQSAPAEQHPTLLRNVAQLQWEQGRAEDAVRTAEQALQSLQSTPTSRPNRPSALASFHASLGEMYYRTGQHELGLSYLDQAASLAPTDAERQFYRTSRERLVELSSSGLLQDSPPVAE